VGKGVEEMRHKLNEVPNINLEEERVTRKNLS